MTSPTFADTLSYLRQIGAGAISVWFIAWAIRRRFDLHSDLTTADQVIRWSIVVVCMTLTLLQGPNLKVVRVMSGICAMCFIAWPDLSHYLMRLCSRGTGENER